MRSVPIPGQPGFRFREDGVVITCWRRRGKRVVRTRTYRSQEIVILPDGFVPR